jgi:hypothetical protein
VFLQKGRFLKKGVWVGRWLWYREKWKTLKGMRDISGCCWICRSMSRYSQLEELKQDPVFQLFCNNKSVLLLFHHYAPVSFVIEAWSPCALTLLCFQIHLPYYACLISENRWRWRCQEKGAWQGKWFRFPVINWSWFHSNSYTPAGPN